MLQLRGFGHVHRGTVLQPVRRREPRTVAADPFPVHTSARVCTATFSFFRK